MLDEPLSALNRAIKKFTSADFPDHSRLHPLKTLHNTYLKRDDELGLSGSKMRKFNSLITYLLQEGIEEAVVIGGLNSNHVLGITQLLIEKGIQPKLFLGESKQDILKGNAILTKLLVAENQIQWISRSEWPKVLDKATIYVDEQGSKRRICIIPEGGCMPEALPGALTLCCDILRNEKELGFAFEHIFVDSGTGLMAMALILGLAFLKHQGHIHVVLIAGTEKEFQNKLKEYQQHFSKLMNSSCPWPTNFSLSRPPHAKSFGSTNAETFKAIKQIAREEGVLCDPLYNAKLLSEAKRKIFNERFEGHKLIIHSGGTLSLLGFLNPD